MSPNFTARSRNSRSRFLHLLGILLFAAAFAVVGNAQSTSATSGYTPAGLAPGTPAGSYALSGFDNINPYNGGMNFSLPLLQVGGRGSAQYTMQLPIEQKWRATHDEICDPQTNQCWAFDTPDFNAWGAIPGYKAGVMNARKIGLFPQTCDYNGSQFTTFTYTLTRLTFTTPDGTEYELRDQLYGGQQLTNSSPCNQNPPSRGTIFITADGTSATFISDAAIYDDLSGGSYDFPSGYLAFRDGTRYRIDFGEVSWMRDRNGNKLTFNGSSSTDSLNRQVTVEGLTDVAPYGLCDRITTSGYGGASRVLRVSWKPLAEVLRDGGSPSTYLTLFPELYHSSQYSTHNPTVVSAVWLPNGQSYKFFYNKYGELARVELPTGGAFEYDWAAGMTGGSASGAYFPMSPSVFIYRRVIERRVYANGGTGSNYDSKMTISRPESYPNFTSDAYVEVRQYKSGNVFQAGTRHYYETGAAATILAGTNNPLGYSSWRDAKEWQTETLASDGSTVLRRENRTWQQRAPISWYTGPPETSPPNDPRLTETITTLVDSNQVSKQTFNYDQYNNQTDVYEYDFGYALLRHTHTDYLTAGYDTNTNIHIRNLPTSVRVNNGLGQQAAHTEYRYDEAAYPLVWYGTVTGWLDPGSARGNATTTRRWVDTTGSYLESHNRPDQVGNVRYAWDAKGNLSQIEYDDAFSDGINTRGTFAYPTKLISPVPDPGNTGFGSNTSLTSHRVYDFSTGLLTSFTDANGKVTSFEYVDPFNRPTRVNRPDTGWTTYRYDRNQYGEYVHTQALQNTSGTLMDGYQFFDKLGRPYRTFQHENHDAVKPWLTVDTEYDGMGRAWRVSQPYRSSGSGSDINPSGKWTESEFDSLGRVKKVTTRPDNAISSISYSGNTVTATDQDGKSRRTVTDALGRLTQAVEDPNGVGYVTDYTYDVLGNLRRVNQGGQYRYFMYDSVGRLIRAKNPEQAAGTIVSNVTDSVTGNGQWSLAYGYDDNGNLTARVDARGITTTYAYDSLNRNTTVRYTDGTKDIDRHYDGAINGRGRFYYSNWDPVNNTRFDTHLAIDEYDVVGRAKIYRQHFYTNGVASGAFTVTRNYDLAGNVISQGYPSGRAVSYAYDISGRLNGFSGTLGDNQQRSYSTGILYDETGGMRQEQFGTDTPIYNKHLYNNRGQLSEIRVSTHSILTPGQETNWNRGAIINHYSHQSWAGSGTENNGNLKKQDVYIPRDDQISNYDLFSQFNEYDSLNRLSSVREQSNGGPIQWQQAYTYDRWGNRTLDQNNSWGGVPEPAFAVDTAMNNRLVVPGGYSGTMDYDLAGNLTNDTYTGQGTRSFDAENRMVSAQDVYGQTTTYTYDADGRRVRRRVAGGAEVWQVYGMDGELLGEYAAGASSSTPQKEYGYRGGELLVQALAPVSSGTGLTGQYFDNMNFANLKITRTDATVNFDWGGGTPYSSIGVDSFTVRWAGKVEPLYSQTYTFYTTTDDGVRLWVNNQLIIDKWIDQGPTEWSGQITLTAGQRYDIRMEFYENGGGAMAKLFWSSASQAKQAIQQSQLYPTTAANAQVDFQWTVNDQLGSPRMVIEKTGSLAGVKRRDFLPFGEELQTGGRTWQMGYVADSVRQKYTAYERDSETNLDYAHARYFSSGLGRFTGVDPMHASASASNPQTWNRYSYGLNNPLRYNDPSGMNSNDIGTAEDQRRQQEEQKKEPQDPPVEVIKINVNDTKIHSVGVNLIDKVDHYGDKRVPIGGEFEITYSYSTTAPSDGTDPSSLGQIAPVTTATGKPSKGTLGSSQQVERVGEPLIIVNKEKEKVEVTKTERFKILKDDTSTNGGTWVINYQVVVSSPTSGQVVSASTLDKKSVVGTGRVPKPIPVVNKLKK